MSLLRSRPRPCAAATLALWLMGTVGLDSAPPRTPEEVRASFLYHFARFTEFPPHAFLGASSPLVVGIVGAEPLRETLDALLRGKAIHGRVVETRKVTALDDLSLVQVLYVRGVSAKTAAFLEGARNRPVLTVGETDAFCEQGGMVAFVTEHDRVRFDVSVEAVSQGGLRVSSRVLSLARSLHGKS